MAQYEPLRNAFHELNKMLVDKQQWDAEHEVRREEMGLKRQMQEQQVQDTLFKRDSLQLESKKAQEQMAPRSVNIYEFFPQNPDLVQHLNDNQELQRNLARSWGGDGIDLATGQVYKEGSVLSLPQYEVGNKSIAAATIMHGALNPTVVTNANLRALNAALENKQSELNGIQDHPINAAPRGKINQDIQRLKGEIANQMQMRDTPEGRIALRNKQLEAMHTAAAQAVNMGASKIFSDLVTHYSAGINSQILEDQKLIHERDKEKRTEKDKVVNQYAIELDTEGNPTGNSRLLSMQQSELTNSAVTPSETKAGKDLGSNWAWQHGLTLKPDKTKPPAVKDWEKALDTYALEAFGTKNELTGVIQLDAAASELNQVRRAVQENMLPDIYKKFGNQIQQVSHIIMGGQIVKAARAEVENYQYEFYKAYVANNQNMEKTKKFMEQDEFGQAFKNTYGFWPNPKLNPFIFPNQSTAQNRGETPQGLNPSGFNLR